MGRVRPEIVKRTARELLEKYRKAFTTDFEHNKQMVMKLTNVKSKKLRNKIEQLKARGIEFKITSMPIGVCVVYELESVRYKPEIPLV